MAADHSLIPFAIPTEDDLGFNLGQGDRSQSPLRIRSVAISPALMIFIWLLATGVMAITAVYHVVADGLGAGLLSWTASAGAVALLMGALVLKQKRWLLARYAQSLEVNTLLLLAAFTVPTAQLLLTLVISQDLSYSVYVMLLVVGYALLATSADSLLLYVTITLAAWSACALRCPAGVWIGYVLPWAGTVGLSLFIHTRFQRLLTLPGKIQSPSTSSVVDVNLEEPLRLAIVERDTLREHKRQLEQQLADQHSQHGLQTDYLRLVQELNQLLSQDVTLQEAGPRWLERLIQPIQAEYAAIWLKEADQQPRQAVSTSVTQSSDEDFVTETFAAGTLLQRGNQWALPLELGLQGRGVLLCQAVHSHETALVERLLRAAAAQLSVFLRWQLAEAEKHTLLHDSHQHRENRQHAVDELQVQHRTHQQVHDHLHTQWQKAEQELITLRSQSSKATGSVDHWKNEAERFKKLVETAQTEHDTLNQLLEEAEAELKKRQVQPDNSQAIKEWEQKQAKLEQKLKASDAERQSATTACESAERELEKLRTALATAQTEGAEAHAEWERETELVNRLNAAFKALADAVAIFDATGTVLVENEPARQLRGSTRNIVGEHPLYQKLITKDRSGQKKPWSNDLQLNGSSYQATITPILQQNQLDGYVIVAHAQQAPAVEPVKPVEVDNTAALAGPRFFGGLAQTLEPPLTLLIDHADTLFDASSDQDIRRQALVGILQQGRHVRRLLTQAVDYAQLEAGQAATQKAPVSPWQLLQQVVNQLRPSAEEKGLNLIVQPSGTLPASITSDPQRLTELVQHVISQAIRHTGSGAIIMKLGMEPIRAGQYAAGKLRLDVSSDARMPAASFAADFAMNLARKQASILHAELMQQASTTSLLVPVTSSELLHLMPTDRLKLDEESLPEVSWLQPLRGKALVVCDGQEQQRVTAYQLERLGLRCEVLADTDLALQRASEDRFDVVLWDAAQRALPLVQACQHLRSQFYQGAILAVGAVASPAIREDFLAAGGDGFLSRPIVLAAWRHVLASFLPEGNVHQPASGEAITSEFHTDRDFFNLIRGYVGKLSAQLAEMRAALQVADIARLIRLAHAMADAGELYGYPALCEQARQLEKALVQGRDTALLTQLVDQLCVISVKIERGVKQARSSGYLALPGPLTRAA